MNRDVHPLLIFFVFAALAVSLVATFFNGSWVDWECKKNKEALENLPTHIECIKDVRILDDNYNRTLWRCALKSETNRVLMIPACDGEQYCDAEVYTMEECIMMLCDIRTKEVIT